MIGMREHLPSSNVETFREDLMTLLRTRGPKWHPKCCYSGNSFRMKKCKCVTNHCSKIFTDHKRLTKS
ncbi:hypothetical protein Hdeb2414_s0394g00884701 [Helianthus debilis subsp. tardiflorus]